MTRSPSKEEMRKALDAFGIETVSDLTVLDRSTLERWTTCPWQAAAIAAKRCVSVASCMTSGIEVHDALSRVTQMWIESNGAPSPSELCQELERELRASRPDVQPDVIAGCIASVWAWSRFMHDIHPGNILAFDGGDDLDPPRSGQLAVDFDDLNVRVTAEVDLLYASESVEVVKEMDYKSGYTSWTADAVAASFQFQMHAMLIFASYEHVNGVDMQVWDTRKNQKTYRVMFDRRREPQYRARARKAVEVYLTQRDQPETWPDRDKCAACPAATICPITSVADAMTVAADPAGFVRHMAALDAVVDNMKAQAAAYVDATGKDIVVDGIAFGRSKPASTRKPTATLYEVER